MHIEKINPPFLYKECGSVAEYRAGLELSRIAQLDQRTALPDQCLHSAEADVRPPQGGSPGLTRGHQLGRAARSCAVARPGKDCNRIVRDPRSWLPQITKSWPASEVHYAR